MVAFMSQVYSPGWDLNDLLIIGVISGVVRLAASSSNEVVGHEVGTQCFASCPYRWPGHREAVMADLLGLN